MTARSSQSTGRHCGGLGQAGGIALRGGVGEQNGQLRTLTEEASRIQLDSLPEIPLLVDVPCLSAQLDESILNIVKARILSMEQKHLTHQYREKN